MNETLMSNQFYSVQDQVTAVVRIEFAIIKSIETKS